MTLLGPLQFLGSFEEYEVHWAKTYGYDKSNLPTLNKTKEDYEKLQLEMNNLVKRIEEK